MSSNYSNWKQQYIELRELECFNDKNALKFDFHIIIHCENMQKKDIKMEISIFEKEAIESTVNRPLSKCYVLFDILLR